MIRHERQMPEPCRRSSSLKLMLMYMPELETDGAICQTCGFLMTPEYTPDRPVVFPLSGYLTGRMMKQAVRKGLRSVLDSSREEPEGYCSARTLATEGPQNLTAVPIRKLGRIPFAACLNTVFLTRPDFCLVRHPQADSCEKAASGWMLPWFCFSSKS